MHLRDESVADSREGLNVSRNLCRITERLTQLFYGCVYAVLKIYEGFGWPEPFANILSRQDFAWPLKQHDEYLKGLPMQLELCPKLPQLPLLRAYFEGLEPKTG